MSERVEVAVVGAGQAGLAASYWLAEYEIGHVLFERDRPGVSWRDRWDSFCLVTPNWTLDLPGFPYDSDDPDGFMPRDAIADYVVRYREFLDAPVRESTEVSSLRPSDDGWILTTDGGEVLARSVVVATGAFPFLSIPPVAGSIHSDLLQLHSQQYRRPSALPDGGVMVVGSGQSGAQIVDDLVIGGREVWFSIGESGRGPRRYRGKDMAFWLREVGFTDMAVTEEMRQGASIMVSGRDGGKDLNLRAFGRNGVHLVGRVLDADQWTLTLGDDVEEVVDEADRVAAQLQDVVDRHIAEHEIVAPRANVETIDWAPGATPTRLDLYAAGINSLVWATGYHYDFSWIDADIFDSRGYPSQQRGVTSEPGLYFIGLFGMHTVGSALFSGVGADAQHVVNHLAEFLD
jgi:putative flavoprotein involved in K+ transport